MRDRKPWKAHQLARDVGSLGIANMLGKVLWAISLTIAMRQLGAEDYGRLVVVWSMAGIVAPLTDLGLSTLLLREGARDASRIAALARMAGASRVLVGLLVTILLLAGLGTEPGVMPAGAVLLAVLGPLVDSAFLTVTALAQVEYRLQSLALWRVIGMAAMPLLLLVAGGAYGVAGVAASWVAASAVATCGFLVVRAVARYERVTPAAVSLLPALRSAFPFLLLGVAALAYGKAEVVLLGKVASASEAALYHAAYQIVLLVFSCADILFTALNARLFRTNACASSLAERWQLMCRFLCALPWLVVPPLWWHAEEVMTLVGGQAFAQAGPVLRALMPMLLALPLSAAFNFLVLLDRPGERAILDAVCVVLTLGLGFWAAHRGATAMGWAASAVYWAACVAAWLRARHADLRLQWFVMFCKASLAAAAAMAVFLIPAPWFAVSLTFPIILAAILLGTGFLSLADWERLGRMGMENDDSTTPC